MEFSTHSICALRGAPSGLHPPDATPQRLTAYLYRRWGRIRAERVTFARFPTLSSEPGLQLSLHPALHLLVRLSFAHVTIFTEQAVEVVELMVRLLFGFNTK
jgi:hypothetical protein